MPFLVKKVLVVEDSEPFRALVRIVLGSLGVDQIVEVADGQEAIETLKNFDAELIVMDWMMPGMDGIECTRRIRCVNDIPIVMVTGRDSVNDIQIALECGANAYVAKPVTMTRLFAAFMRAVAAPSVDDPLTENA
jgi:two-component system chemotaxis response regulator CheY